LHDIFSRAGRCCGIRRHPAFGVRSGVRATGVRFRSNAAKPAPRRSGTAFMEWLPMPCPPRRRSHTCPDPSSIKSL